jgi:aconitase A
MAGPSNPHARLADARAAAKGIAGNLEAARPEAQGLMPDGAVIIAAITSPAPTPATRAM